MLLFFLFGVLAMHAVAKFVKGEDKFSEEFYLYLFCWFIFAIYECIDRLWWTKADGYWIKQSSSDYKELHKAYLTLDSYYDQLKTHNTFLRKQTRYLEYVLRSKDIKLTRYYFNRDEFNAEIASLDQRIKELKATINWDKESSTGKQKVTSSVNPENANTLSGPSTSDPTVAVDQEANSGVSAPKADSSANPENTNTTPSSPSTSDPTVAVDQEADSGVTARNADPSVNPENAHTPSGPSTSDPTAVADDQVASSGVATPDAGTESVESETAQVSAECKTGELTGDEQKAKQEETGANSDFLEAGRVLVCLLSNPTLALVSLWFRSPRN